MELNQSYYLNVILLKIFFKELGRFGSNFFTKCSKCYVLGSIQLTLFYEISSIGSRVSFI